MDKIKRLVLVTTALLFISCKTTKLETASGRPEIDVRDKLGLEIRRGLNHFMTDRGYLVWSSDDLTMAFDKEASKWATLRYGSLIDSETWVRMEFSIIQLEPFSYRVIASPLIVTDRGSSFESAEPLKGQHLKEAQVVLDEFGAYLSTQGI